MLFQVAFQAQCFLFFLVSLCAGEGEPLLSSRLGHELTFTYVQQLALQSGEVDSEF